MDLQELLTPQTWSVGEITRYIREKLESDFRLSDILVAGEVSNLSRPTSGHLYFTLKDKEASLRCVMWRPRVGRQTYLPENGDAVEVRGHISVYDVGGQYQLYADRIHPAGEGDRFQEFLRLKEQLESEGIFDEARKQPTPTWPKRIGIVTSPTGAALQDVLDVLQRRYPLPQVILSPTPVQGDDAAERILAALDALINYADPDVILLVRGGGSVEDLWAFNDEDLVRAVGNSPIPLVTGIGHASDLILCDFAADVRAPTPSAAAEVATPDRISLVLEAYDSQHRISSWFQDELDRRRYDLDLVLSALQLRSPRVHLSRSRQLVDDLSVRARAAMQYELALARTQLAGIQSTLSAVSPTDVLSRGYALVSREEDGQLVRSVNQTAPGDNLIVQVQDGVLRAIAGEVKEHHDGE